MASTSEPGAVESEKPSQQLSSAPSLDRPGTPSLPDSNSVEKALQTAEEPAKPPRNVTGPLWGLVVLSILSSTFLFSLDNTIVADVQPAIVRQFNATDKLPWLSVAFLLGAASSNLFWYVYHHIDRRQPSSLRCMISLFSLQTKVLTHARGQCYGQFDAKYVYMLCVTLFEVGSAVCGAAPSMDALIIGRAICGLGGAGMYTGVMTLLTVTTLPHERPIYFGLCGLTWGTGTILGPIIGGAFTDSKAGLSPLNRQEQAAS